MSTERTEHVSNDAARQHPRHVRPGLSCARLTVPPVLRAPSYARVCDAWLSPAPVEASQAEEHRAEPCSQPPRHRGRPELQYSAWAGWSSALALANRPYGGEAGTLG